MKGKIAFVIGAALGYVLGARAGRARYEQIKRGASKVWNAEPVQRGVSLVRDAVDERAGDVVSFVRRASADAFSNYADRADQKSQQRRSQGQPESEAAAPESSNGSSGAS